MTNNHDIDNYEWVSCLDVNFPPKVGWYAILYSWDVMEGIFIGCHYWDGKEWNEPVFMWSGPFSSKEQAYKWAADHDPEY